MPDVPEGYKLERSWSLTQFLIGVFGATAILGVMAKIFNFETEIFGYLITWKPVVLIGFMGEALVFILMGMMREMRYVRVDEEEETAETSDADEDELFGPEFTSAEEALTEETERLAQQIREIRRDLSGQIMVLEEFNELRENLHTASNTLSDHSDMLGESMEDLRDLYEAQTSMVRSVENVQKALSEEAQGLGEEFADTRSTMEDLRSSYEAQASMVESVEQLRKELSEGAQGFGDEIAETRKAMRLLRDQFQEAARRFEQFNAPPSAPEPSADEQPTNNVSTSVK